MIEVNQIKYTKEKRIPFSQSHGTSISGKLKRMSIVCTCKKEFIVENQKFSDAVIALEWLRKAVKKSDTEKVYKAYEECYQNMKDLARKICKIDNGDIVDCKSMQDGLVLVVELDYLDEGEFPNEVIEWPSAEELEDAGYDSLVGAPLEVTDMSDTLDFIDKEEQMAWEEEFEARQLDKDSVDEIVGG